MNYFTRISNSIRHGLTLIDRLETFCSLFYLYIYTNSGNENGEIWILINKRDTVLYMYTI
jgi:hypothetical protein